MNQQLILMTMMSILATSCASTNDEIIIDEAIFVDEIDADNAIDEPALTGESSLSGEAALTDETVLASEPALTTERVVSGEPMSITDMNDVLVGNTYPLDDGEIYFHSETIATLYRGESSEQMDWWQNDGGGFCYGLKFAGGVEECVGLFRHENGDYLHSFEGTTRVIQRNDIFPRNRFD